LSSFITSVSSILKAAALLALVLFVIVNKEFVENWLSSLSGGEVAGVKFEREVIDQATLDLQKLADEVAAEQSQRKKENMGELTFDEDLAKTAILRAARVAPAIVNSLLLWVDDGWGTQKAYNEFNELVIGILKKLEISVVRVTSTKDAMKAMQTRPFDIVIGVAHAQDRRERAAPHRFPTSVSSCQLIANNSLLPPLSIRNSIATRALPEASSTLKLRRRAKSSYQKA